MNFLAMSACGLMGLIIGAAAVGLFWWAYHNVVVETALDPLADLKIEKDSLTPEEVKRFIEQLGEGYVRGKPSCIAVGIVKGQYTDFLSFGRLSDGRQPDADTVFEIASVGKTFTALVLADMEQRNELRLSESIDALLPEGVTAPHRDGVSISLIDLATHTSGLPSLPANMRPSNPLNPYADYTVEQMYEALSSVQLDGPIGRRYAYSNLGFGVLGQLLARRAQTDFESLVVSRVCDPLQMNSTRMTLGADLRARVAQPHSGGKPVEVWEDTTMAGAGSFLSTTSDMLKYVRAHWEPSDDALHRAMREAIVKRRPTDKPATAIGLAWHIDSENALDVVWHNGGAGGSRSYVTMLPDEAIGVVVLANSSDVSVEEFGRKILYLLMRQE
ncbi:MAG: serine hydrolase domain-containing protein [Aureliella sp.]